MIDLGHVVNAQAAFACRHVGVFAAQLDLQDARIPFVFVAFFQLAAAIDKFAIVIRIGNFLQRAAVDRLRIRMLSGDHRFEHVIRSNVNVPAHEVDEVGPLQQHLGQPGVVIILI